MIDSIYNALTVGSASTLSALFTGFIMRYIMKREAEQNRKNEEELRKVKEEQWNRIKGDVEKLEQKLDGHITTDKTEVIMTTLNSISGNITKLLDQQQALISADSEQKSQIITLFKTLKEQKEDLRECQKEHKK